MFLLPEGHRPFAALLRIAKEHQVDMVVAGTESKLGVERLILGSTAEELIRSAGFQEDYLRYRLFKGIRTSCGLRPFLRPGQRRTGLFLEIREKVSLLLLGKLPHKQAAASVACRWDAKAMVRTGHVASVIIR
jgi:hypothetical protein